MIAENSQLVWSIVLPESINSFIVTVSLHAYRQLRLRLLVAIVIIRTFQHCIHNVSLAR